MKRTIAFIIALMLAVSTLFACASPADEKGTEGSTAAPSPAGTSSETDAPVADEEDEPYAYLFAYFTGNDPSQERICFAVSTDGCNFKPLNYGKPVVTQTQGTGCVRDPYIFRGNDGAYYMIGTDMKSSLGWSSNRHLISWRSEDLITWTDETIIKIDGEYKSTRNTTRAWAPQALWNEDRGEYMIYFALQSAATGGRTIMYYAYSPDLKTLSTEPALLFAPTNGHDAIDSDIVYYDGLYYMFFKDETSGGIHLMTSEHMDSGWNYDEAKLVTPQGLAVEGSSAYPLIDGSGWILISDAYMSGYFIMEKTTDLASWNFSQLGADEFSFKNFTPRHGSVIHITKEQYDAITEAFPVMRTRD